MKVPKGYYGNSAIKAWWAGLQDRRAGLSHRANARWGWLRPPGGRGPALWMQTTDVADDVLLAAELTQAIREKRLDLRVILTFEADYPELLDARIGELKGVGYGYGPADHPRALRRTLDRLSPLRIMTVGQGPRSELARLSAQRGIASVVVAGDPTTTNLPQNIETIYPVDARQANRWRSLGASDAQLQPPVDFLTLITIAQVDPNFRRYVCGSAELDLWWLHGVAAADAPRWIEAWRQAGLADSGILFIQTREDHYVWPLLSEWAREPLPTGSVVGIDDRKWLPALAAACTGIHLAHASRGDGWQAMAGGKPVTFGSPSAFPIDAMQTAFDESACLDDAANVMQSWRTYADNPIAGRQLGDAMRRYFWDERRKAQIRLPDLLQQVFDW